MRKSPRPRLHALMATAFAALTVTPPPASAQERPAPLVLDPITVIGTGLPTGVMTNPASVTVIEGEELARRPAVSIAGLLRDVPGLAISEEGIERISLRGEQSRRIAILIDGQALSDHGNYGQPIPVDPTQIERIEVVRGSSSVVSGNRAIGGVINIITKQGADKPFELTTSAGWFSATRGWRASIAAAGTVPFGAGEFDYRLGFGKMDQGNRRIPDGVAESTAASDRNLSLHAGYRQGNHHFGLRGQATDLAANVYTINPPGVTDWTVDLPRRDLRKVALFYEGIDLAPWLDKLSFDVYRQTIAREFINDITQSSAPGMSVRVQSESVDDQRTAGLNLTAEMRFSERTRTVAGLEYEDDRLTTDKLTMTSLPFPPFATRREGRDEAKIRTISAFAEHEIEFSPTLTGTFGARWYRVRADHDVAIENDVPNPTGARKSSSLGLGAAGLVWSPDDTLALRANISQGYIYPTLGQLYLTTTGGSNTIRPNPDLKPERTTTYELGARYSQGGLDMDATLFHMASRDYIAYFVDGSDESQYENVSAARSWGLELQAQYASDIWDLTPYISAAAMRRQLRFDNGFRTHDSGAPRFSGRIGVRKLWSLADRDVEADLFLRGESRTTLRDASGAIEGAEKGIAKDNPGWATLNLSTRVQWENGVALVAEVTNLANRRYRPYEQAPGAERGISLFLTKTF